MSWITELQRIEILLTNFKFKSLCVNSKWLFGEKPLIFWFSLGATEFYLVLRAITSCILTVFLKIFDKSCSSYSANKLCKGYLFKPYACAVILYLVI